jgi:branched-chain amino acid transport system substrate-binding protein
MKARIRRCRDALTGVGLALLAGACGSQEDVLIGVANSSITVDAARLAFADAAAGGLAGVDTVMVAEGTNEAGPAIGMAQLMVADHGVIGVVGHSNSSASLAAAGIYNERQVVQVAPTSSATVYSQAGPYSFRLVPPDEGQAGFLVEAVAAAFPAGARIALVYVNDDYGRGLRNAVRVELPDRPGEIVLEVPYLERDIESAQIEQAGQALRAAAPDVILWLGRGSTLEQFLPTLSAVVPDAMILGADGVASGRQLDAQDGRWNGVRHVDFLDMQGTPALREFAARYEARFGRAATASDALTYDATRLLLAGVVAGARTGPMLREYLLSLGRSRPAYEGITGPISFDERGEISRGYVLTGWR